MISPPQAAVIEAARKKLKAGRKQLTEQFVRNPRPRNYLRQHARLVDLVLAELSQQLLPPQVAVAAVGGYGRNELYPASDVDILLLVENEPEGALQSALETWVQSCWDAGLEIGHSVRTVTACLNEAAHDISIATNLFENRLLWGSRKLFRDFTEAYSQQFNAPAFMEAKLLESRARHLRYEDSAYKLEPNIKESPGGLRDLQVIMWLARAAGLTPSWTGLVKAGYLTATEASRIASKESFLLLLRIYLHLLANRREDRLAFDFQADLARQIGLDIKNRRQASEQVMKRYYRAAQQVLLINEILAPALMRRVIKERLKDEPIDHEFMRMGEALCIRSPLLFEVDPTALFRAFLVAMQHSIHRFGPESLRALWRASKKINRAFRADPANRQAFIEILRQPHGVTWALQAMGRYGILGRYIPAFGRITGQMQHDLFHVYTVDEHILTVLRNLRRFTVTELAHEYPLASRLISTFDKPELLYLAALFHDIAKGRGGDHSVMGTADARRFCRMHGLSRDDADLVEWLVREHLSMSHIAQKEDLSDPQVIATFAKKVGDALRLSALYILTVADIRGTSPTVWNAWKGKLLDELYHATLAKLTGQSSANTHSAKQEEARTKLALYGIEKQAVDRFWRTLDESYFLRFDANDLAWHARMLWQKPEDPKDRVFARLSPVGAGIQVLVYCKDRPDLFERICGFFAHNQFSIVEAKIHTTLANYALDSFQVLDNARRDVHYRDFLQFIEYELAAAIDPLKPPPSVPAARLSRRVKLFPIQPSVDIRSDERGRYQVLTLTCGDRVGLLHTIATLFHRHHVDLYSAKIETLGERVEDRFLIKGDSLSKQKTLLNLETDLLTSLSV